MANALYPKGKKKILDADIDLLTDTIKAMIVDGADETYNAADEFVSDIASAGIVGRSNALTGKTTTGGLFDADNGVVPSASGDPIEVVVLYKDTGSDATSPLIAWMDVSSYSPTGVDANIAWHPSGIFAI